MIRNILGFIGGMLACIVFVVGLFSCAVLLDWVMSERVTMILFIVVMCCIVLIGLPVCGYSLAKDLGWIKRMDE